MSAPNLSDFGADYSKSEAYLLNSEIMYRPERYYYPLGNSPQYYPRTYGAGRPQVDYRNSEAGRAINNPYVDKTCYLQPPLVWMQSAPFDPRTGKFTDTFFYKNHRFSPGSN